MEAHRGRPAAGLCTVHGSLSNGTGTVLTGVSRFTACMARAQYYLLIVRSNIPSEWYSSTSHLLAVIISAPNSQSRSNFQPAAAVTGHPDGLVRLIWVSVGDSVRSEGQRRTTVWSRPPAAQPACAELRLAPVWAGASKVAFRHFKRR